jgi:hypothetical protein
LGRGDPGVLQCFPTDLKEQALLWVNVDGFARRDVKEGGVEPVDAIQEAPMPAVHLSGSVGIGVIERLLVPSVRGNLGDGVHPVTEQLPEGFRGVGVARKPTADTDDGDRLSPGFFEGVQLSLQLQAQK